MSFPYVFDQEVARYRLAVSRKLNNITQKKAAKLLGFKNSGALSKIENQYAAYGNRKITIELLYNASILYGVNIAYLVGLTASVDYDVNAGNQAALLRGIRFQLELSTKRVSKQLEAVSMETLPMLDQIIVAISLIEKIQLGFEKFKTLNPVFEEEMRGSATLSNDINELLKWARKENRTLARARKAKQISIIMGMEDMDTQLIDEKIEDILGDECMKDDKEAQIAFDFPVAERVLG